MDGMVASKLKKCLQQCASVNSNVQCTLYTHSFVDSTMHSVELVTHTPHLNDICSQTTLLNAIVVCKFKFA